MSFPEYIKNPFSTVINYQVVAAAVSLGGAGLASVSYLALKTLGVGKVVTATVAAVPAAVGAAGAVGVVVGGGALFLMAKKVKKTLTPDCPLISLKALL